jgi:hypothetical protein
MSAAPSPLPEEPETFGPPIARAGLFTGPLAGILLGNAVTFFGATFQHWPAQPVMLIYWGQSVAIGLANVVRMLMLKDFSTNGLTSGGRPVPATPAGKRMIAGFFALHYGMFHLVYLLFLTRGHFARMDPLTLEFVAANIALFAGSHLWHVISTHGSDYRGRPNLGTLMFYPYLRIIPMHLAIIFGSMFPAGALPLFILLKTCADLGLHAVECRVFSGTQD